MLENENRLLGVCFSCFLQFLSSKSDFISVEITTLRASNADKVEAINNSVLVNRCVKNSCEFFVSCFNTLAMIFVTCHCKSILSFGFEVLFNNFLEFSHLGFSTAVCKVTNRIKSIKLIIAFAFFAKLINSLYCFFKSFFFNARLIFNVNIACYHKSENRFEIFL